MPATNLLNTMAYYFAFRLSLVVPEGIQTTVSTESAGNILAGRMAEYKQKQGLVATLPTFERVTRPIIIKPAASSWEQLEQKLEQVINLDGLWVTVRSLYDQGMGAELETAAEIALATAKKSPFNLFAAMVSKKSGNWATRTLKMVQETWSVRRNALEVMDRLKLAASSAKAILAMGWRLKGTMMRFLGIATEQGAGVKNPTGLFFALTKKPKAA